MRRTLIAVTSVAALLIGYGTADAYDRVPGVLTIDEEVTREAPEAPDTAPVLPAASTEVPVPTTAGLTAALEEDATAKALGERVGVVVRDALTGETLYSHGGDRPITPASTAKLLTAAAVVLAVAVGVAVDPASLTGARTVASAIGTPQVHHLATNGSVEVTQFAQTDEPSGRAVVSGWYGNRGECKSGVLEAQARSPPEPRRRHGVVKAGMRSGGVTGGCAFLPPGPLLV